MKKNKLSLIFTILTVICIFSVAAIADQCGCRAIPIEEKIDVGETEEDVSSEEKEETSEESKEEKAGEAKDEEVAEEETTETQEEETSEEQEQAEAPTIELEVFEGPIYSSSDNVCYYRIKANITGTPTPDVEFSKDDSGGAWGKFKCQVNLNDPTETYTLTATATNSEGSDSDSVDISWECNSPPEIAEITLIGNHYVGLEYTVSAVVVDPDGDILSYNWSVTGGSLDNPSSDFVKWTMPSTTGNYEITVTVDDGNGGQAEKTETVEVLDLPSVSLPQIPGGGTIIEGLGAAIGLCGIVGDTHQNKAIRGFLNFDISSLAGKEVVSAEMEFSNFHIENDPYSIIEKIWMESVYWGTGNIELGDYNIPGILLGEYDIPTFTCSSTQLIDIINQAIDNGHDRFQIRLSHKGLQTNHNGSWDSIAYGDPWPIRFNITYIP